MLQTIEAVKELTLMAADGEMHNPGSPPPQTIVQAGGKVAESLVGGFQGTPALLLIVILNIAMISVAGYYFLQQEELRNDISKELVILIRACILDTEPATNRRAQDLRAPYNPLIGE